MIAIPLARYRFECLTTRDIVFNEFSGSDLRSIFGSSLRTLSCVTNMSQCEGCPVQADCPYGKLFSNKTDRATQSDSNQTTLNPYIIEPPEWGVQLLKKGETWSFHLILMGATESLLPLIILAWKRGLEQGLGKKSAGRATLLKVMHCQADGNEALVLDPVENLIRPHEPTLYLDRTPNASIKSVTLNLLTPTRLQFRGHVLTPRSVKPRDMVEILTRRVRLLFPQQMDNLFHDKDHEEMAKIDGIRTEGQLEFCDWKRYSASQRREMNLGGLMGQWTWFGDVQPFMTLLKLGEWLHVGKNVTFGMGQYRMEVMK